MTVFYDRTSYCLCNLQFDTVTKPVRSMQLQINGLAYLSLQFVTLLNYTALVFATEDQCYSRLLYKIIDKSCYFLRCSKDKTLRSFGKMGPRS